MLAGFLALPPGTDAFGKEKKKVAPPDMAMLEFLGTYETEDGKMIDPLKLPEQPRHAKAKAKPAAGGTISKKPQQKKDGSND